MGKGGMDYKGQKLSEQIYLVLIPAVGSVAWVFGYLAQDFKKTFYGCDRGVPACCGVFTSLTRVVSRNDGSGWSLFRF